MKRNMGARKSGLERAFAQAIATAGSIIRAMDRCTSGSMGLHRRHESHQEGGRGIVSYGPFHAEFFLAVKY